MRRIFERFAKCRSATAIVRELVADGFVNKYGQKLDKGRIYKLLHNRVYVGDAVHKGTAYPGEHEAIIPKALWDRVQAVLAESPKVRAGRTRAQTPALLKGLIFGPDGRAMSPTHTRRGDKLYRYYVSQSVIKGSSDDSTVGRLAAAEIEAAVVEQIRALLRSPEVVVATWRSARLEIDGLTEAEVREALERLDPLWDELFPAEQARIVQLLVERILGMDIFDPTTGEVRSSTGKSLMNDVAAWFIDHDYDEESFFVRQAYFVGDNPYDGLRRALKAEIDDTAWAELNSTVSRRFPRPARGLICVKVINHFGDEVQKVFRVGAS